MQQRYWSSLMAKASALQSAWEPQNHPTSSRGTFAASSVGRLCRPQAPGLLPTVSSRQVKTNDNWPAVVGQLAVVILVSKRVGRAARLAMAWHVIISDQIPNDRAFELLATLNPHWVLRGTFSLNATSTELHTQFFLSFQNMPTHPRNRLACPD